MADPGRREFVRHARTVAASLDAGSRVESAHWLREALDPSMRRRVGRAMMRGRLSHSDACPRIIAACCTGKEAAFERLVTGLTEFRGADLLHVGISRSIYDRLLERRLRNWGKAAQYPIPRLLIFDGPWAEPDARGRANRFDVLERLFEWLDPGPATNNDMSRLQAEYATYLIWRELLSKPDRFEYWADSVRDRWPRRAGRLREIVFALCEALHRHQSPRIVAGDAVEQLAMTLFRLEHLQTQSDAMTSAEVASLLPAAQPSMLAGQMARTLGALYADGRLRDAMDVIERFTAPLPSDPSEPYDDRVITGFLVGLEARAAGELAVRDVLVARLQMLHTSCSDEVDVFARVRGAVVGALVSLGHGDFLIERMRDATAHPYELTLGCRALARAVRRGGTSMIRVADEVLAELQSRMMPWSFAVLDALASALPAQDAWIELKRRVEIAKAAAPADRLLAPKVTSAVLGKGDDDFIALAVRNHGQVPPWELWAMREETRGSVERLRRLEREAASRIQRLREWFSRAPETVAPDELVTFLSVLQRVHLTWFLDGLSDNGVHVLALDVVRSAPTRWKQVFRPLPAGRYAFRHFLDLVAAASLVSTPDTVEVCETALTATWSMLVRDHRGKLAPADLTYFRRALVATACRNLALPIEGDDASIARDTRVLVGLAQLEARLGAAPERPADLLREELDHLNSLDIPLDARGANVVQLMLHNLANRLDRGEAPDATMMIRRLRALLGGPTDPTGSLDDVIGHALELTGAPARRPPVRLMVDDLRRYDIPYVVALLVIEEMIANALEHGEPTRPVDIEVPSGSSVVGVLSDIGAGQQLDAVVAHVNQQRASGSSGMRFASQVASKWGMVLNVDSHAGRLRVALARRASEDG